MRGLKSTLYQLRRMHSFEYLKQRMEISTEVKEALSRGKPVVALESTIITHGMPYPENYTTALEIEDIVRKGGCTPATIALLNGKICVGLTNEQIQFLAKTGLSAKKTSRRDISSVLIRNLVGATTVSGTMVVAKSAGIPIFVTGGIGGVHRGAETTFDVSADLTELGRTNVTVVCAGVKSILDIPKTLEYLETQGVTVATYGKTDDFPAFYSPVSGYKSPYHFTTIQECAELIDTHNKLGLQNGIVIGVPIPSQDLEKNKEIEEVIQKGIHEANQRGISGASVTPFLLDFVKKGTKGESLTLNIELIKNNATVGAQIANKLSKLNPVSNLLENTTIQKSRSNRAVFVIGGAAVDILSTLSQSKLTNNASIDISYGGVARNICEGLARLGISTKFTSIIGNDIWGSQLKNNLEKLGIPSTDLIQSSTHPTAIYNSISEFSGTTLASATRMGIFDQFSADETLLSKKIQDTSLICLDANLPIEAMSKVCSIASKHNTLIWYEPTSQYKSAKIVKANVLSHITFLSPTFSELLGICQELHYDKKPELESLSEFLLSLYPQLNIIVTLGHKGVFLARKENVKQPPSFQIFECNPNIKVVNKTGAGDSFASGVIASILSNQPLDVAIRCGIAVAEETIQTHQSIAHTLTPKFLHDLFNKFKGDSSRLPQFFFKEQEEESSKMD